jgi:hypothetical protein
MFEIEIGKVLNFNGLDMYDNQHSGCEFRLDLCLARYRSGFKIKLYYYFEKDP